ncbi:hypothetical protein HID58_006896 [Brassica napus]|uniref:Uncharacterized protein n=1 Tax=Brassica napus TaxID=3708 RepID=A0ABQ8ECU1_BRANA|nr:hypothetical protein HID58_006896 [Brassica napus]
MLGLHRQGVYFQSYLCNLFMLLGLEPCRSCGSLEVPCKRTLQLANGLSASSCRELNTLSNAQKMSHHPEGASNSNDEGVSVEPPAPSPKKKKKDKRTTGKSSDETSLPLSASLATSSEGQGTKKKKKKKRTRDEATSRDEATAMDDATPVERPKKKVKKKAAGTEPGSSVVVPSSADAAREGEVIPNVSLEEKRKALVQRSGSGSESADITSALSERIVVPEGTTIEERPDGSDPETGGAIQTDTGDVAAEDPVLVSSSEEREEDEVGEEENRSSSALVEGMVPNLPVSDPPAQVEGLGNQVREEQTIEALDPSRDDQDVVV